MSQPRNPKTGRFVKKTTSGSGQKRDPVTGKFVKN